MPNNASIPNRLASASRKSRPARAIGKPIFQQLYGALEDTQEDSRMRSLKATTELTRVTRPNNQPPRSPIVLQPTAQGPVLALDKLANVRGALKQARQGYRKEVYEVLAQAYEIAIGFRHDGDSWLDFCRHADWSSFKGVCPKPRARHDALRYVLRFAVGFDGKSATKRVNKLTTALYPAFRSNLPPEAVLDYIRDGGGIEALARANAKRKTNNSLSSKIATIKIPIAADSNSLLSWGPGEIVSLMIKIKGIHGAIIDAEIQETSPVSGR